MGQTQAQPCAGSSPEGAHEEPWGHILTRHRRTRFSIWDGRGGPSTCAPSGQGRAAPEAAPQLS